MGVKLGFRRDVARFAYILCLSFLMNVKFLGQSPEQTVQHCLLCSGFQGASGWFCACTARFEVNPGRKSCFVSLRSRCFLAALPLVLLTHHFCTSSTTFAQAWSFLSFSLNNQRQFVKLLLSGVLYSWLCMQSAVLARLLVLASVCQ